MNEKKTAAASYIVEFYKEVQTLNHNYAIYLNTLSQLEAQHGSTIEGLTDGERDQFIQIAQLVRYSVTKTKIAYTAISSSVKKATKKLTDKDTDEVIKKFVPGKEALKNYVEKINSFLIQDIIQELLQSSQDIITDVYK